MSKVRIYELSKELNLDNKDIKEICEQLNIAVKSHSSTITEDQAERVKSVAQKYTPSEKTANNTNQEAKHKKPTAKRKQQILAIHHKIDSPTPKPPAKRNETSSVPSLAAPPNRPNQTKNTEVTAQEESPVLAKPPHLKTTAKTSASPTPEIKTPPGREKQSPTNNLQAEKPTPTPKLVGPPAKPQLAKPAVKKNAAKPASEPAIAESSKSSELKAEKSVKEKSDKSEKRSKPAAPQLPKLQQKPQRIQAVAKPKEEELEDNQTDVVESNEIESDEEVIISKTETKKNRLKRPSLTRKPKWENEEDDEQESKAIKAKKRRQPKPVIDDDDEFETEELNVTTNSTAVSLSTARPPKPESLQQKPAATSGTKKPKKPAPKTEKTPKAERQSRKAATPTISESIVLSNSLTVRDLAQRLNIQETEIIKSLFFKGIPVNITQTLDLETARLVAEELGVSVETPEEKSAAAKEEILDVDDLDNLQPRPPVVTIMGHVDHGKTTLLDSIRKSKVAQGEAGGITQHIGAYHVDVEHNDSQQQIVFLDTPGHEAFTAMRARGTKVTDIAILVVAADDGVQPQTKEAISHAKAADVPIIVAINKVDKPEANPDRIKQELAEQELVPEDWGGDTTMVPVSALKGDNLDELLEMILLVAEIEELSANPDRLAKGTVIEANLDRTRGPVATLLIQNGTLRVGDSVVAGSILGKVRAMIDDTGNKVEEATPSFAVEILGLNGVPEAGDEFEVYPTEKEARAVADERAIEQRDSRLLQSMSSRRVSLSNLSAQAQEGELKELNLIIKADVQGSVEAILGSLQQLPQNEVQIRVLLASPGEVTETDVDLSAASGAVIIGFNTTLASGVRQAADREGVDIRQYSIIYKLLDEIQGAMEGLLDPEEVEESLGEAEVRAVFPVGRSAVAGCYVISGRIVRNCQIRVRRGNKVVYEGALTSLKRMKEDAKEVNTGFECGIGAGKFGDWQEGDIIEAYEMAFKRRTLATS